MKRKIQQERKHYKIGDIFINKSIKYMIYPITVLLGIIIALPLADIFDNDLLCLLGTSISLLGMYLGSIFIKREVNENIHFK